MEQEKSMQKTNVKFWAVALLLGALLMFGVGGYPLVKQIALDGFGVKATGLVVEVVGGDQVKTPSVQFTTADGEQVTFRSYYGNKNIRFATGEQVEMRYLAVNPQIAEIDMLGHINYPSNFGTTCLGSFLLMGGLVALRNKPLVLDLSRRKS